MAFTPLETYLMAKNPNGGIPLSNDIAIVGTDSVGKDGKPVRGGNLLKILYVNLKGSAQNIDANCLSAVLVNENPHNPKWTGPENEAWIAACIANQALNTFYVAHKNINKALVATAQNGVVTEAGFKTAYKAINGKKGSSYKEVIELLQNGFLNFTYTNISLGYGFGKASILGR